MALALRTTMDRPSGYSYKKPLTPFSLDDPILPSILTSLAANLARSGNLPSQARASRPSSVLSSSLNANSAGQLTSGASTSADVDGVDGSSGSSRAHGDVQDSIKDMQVHTIQARDGVRTGKAGRRGEQEQGQEMLKDRGDGREVPVRGWSDARDVLRQRMSLISTIIPRIICSPQETRGDHATSA